MHTGEICATAHRYGGVSLRGHVQEQVVCSNTDQKLPSRAEKTNSNLFRACRGTLLAINLLDASTNIKYLRGRMLSPQGWTAQR